MLAFGERRHPPTLSQAFAWPAPYLFSARHPLPHTTLRVVSRKEMIAEPALRGLGLGGIRRFAPCTERKFIIVPASAGDGMGLPLFVSIQEGRPLRDALRLGK